MPRHSQSGMKTSFRIRVGFIELFVVFTICLCLSSGVSRNFVRRWGSTNSVEDRGQRKWGSGVGSPLVRGFGGSCNLVQEISFHIVKFSYFWYFKTIYDDNQFICHC